MPNIDRPVVRRRVLLASTSLTTVGLVLTLGVGAAFAQQVGVVDIGVNRDTTATSGAPIVVNAGPGEEGYGVAAETTVVYDGGFGEIYKAHANSTASVTVSAGDDAVALGARGVYDSGLGSVGARIDQTGDVSATSADDDATGAAAVGVFGGGALVTIEGDITTDAAAISTGVYADSDAGAGSIVDVTGDIKATSSDTYAYGVSANAMGTARATVTGDVTVSGPRSAYGVRVSNAGGEASAKITGDVDASSDAGFASGVSAVGLSSAIVEIKGDVSARGATATAIEAAGASSGDASATVDGAVEAKAATGKARGVVVRADNSDGFTHNAEASVTGLVSVAGAAGFDSVGIELASESDATLTLRGDVGVDNGDAVVITAGAGVTLDSEGAITAIRDGIRIKGSDISVMQTGDVTAGGDGVTAKAGASVEIASEGDIKAQAAGLFAQSSSSTATVTSKGAVTGATRYGIVADGDEGGSVVSEGDVVGKSRGIGAYSDSGDASVTSTGDVTAAKSAVDADGDTAPGIAIGAGGETAVIDSEGALVGGAGAVAVALVGETSILSKGDVTASAANGLLAIGAGGAAIDSEGDVSVVVDRAVVGDTDVTLGAISALVVEPAADTLKGGTGDATIVSKGKATASGERGFGLYAQTGTGDADVTQTGDVETSGVGSDAVVAITEKGDAAITLTGDVKTSGANSDGVAAVSQSGAASAVIRGDVTTTGDQSFGVAVFSTGAASADVQGDVTVSGAGPVVIGAFSEDLLAATGRFDVPNMRPFAVGVVATEDSADLTFTGAANVANGPALGVFAPKGDANATIAFTGDSAAGGSALAVQSDGASTATIGGAGMVTAATGVGVLVSGKTAEASLDGAIDLKAANGTALLVEADQGAKIAIGGAGAYVNAIEAVGGHALDLSGDSADLTATLGAAGKIAGGKDAARIRAGGAVTATLDNGGAVVGGENGVDIQGDGDHLWGEVTIVNAGAITAKGGRAINAAAFDVTGSKVSLTNSGTILSEAGGGAARFVGVDQALAVTAVNTGRIEAKGAGETGFETAQAAVSLDNKAGATIKGAGAGVALGGAGASAQIDNAGAIVGESGAGLSVEGAATIANLADGEIQGGGDGLSVGGTGALTNAGTIRGGAFGARFGAGDDTLVNTGLIEGAKTAIAMGGGADQVTLAADSLTLGDILLGDGDDAIAATTANFTGDIDGGAGRDSATFASGGSLDFSRLPNIEAIALSGGAYVFSGATSVGVVTLASDSSASANGVTLGGLTNNGVISIADGQTLTTGDYTAASGATTLIGLSQTTSGRIQASGAVDLQSGSALKIDVTPDVDIANGQTFTLATGASVADASTLTDNSLLFKFSADASSGDALILTAQRELLFADNLTNDGNLQHVGPALDTAVDANAALRTALEDALARGETEDAILRSLAPDDSFGAVRGALLAGGQRRTALSDRIANRVGVVPPIASGEGGSGAIATTMAAAPAPRAALWMRAFGGVADQSATGAIAGYRATAGGAALGADYEIAPGAVLGAGVAYTHVAADSTADTRMNGFGGFVYGAKSFGPALIEAQAHYGFNRYESDRVTGVGLATGSYDGQEYGVALRGSYAIALEEDTRMAPEAWASWTHVATDGYSETGVGGLTYGATGADSTVVGLGVSFRKDHREGLLRVSPSARIGVEHEFASDVSQTAQFNAGGASFVTQGGAGGTRMTLGFGVELSKDGVGSVRVGYDGAINPEDYAEHRLSLSLRMPF